MHIPTCSRGFSVALISVVLSGALAGCALEDQSAPRFTGPSEFALSVTLSATPNQLPRDGSSQAVVTVTVRDASGSPVAGQHLSISASTGSVSQSEVVTGSGGQATFAFVAPAPGGAGSAVIRALPIGANSDAAVARTLIIGFTGTPNTTAPMPSFTVTPTSPQINQAVRFDASATTDEGGTCLDACTYSWNFGDASTGTGRIVNHTYTGARTYTVTLTATDAAGSSASTAQSVIVANVVAPTVTLAVAPDPPLKDQLATFTATATPASGHSITRYSWNFGDGSSTQTTTGPTVTKTYSAQGTYVATVTVTDDVGQTASQSKQFTIVSAGVTASFTSSPTNPVSGASVRFDGVASTGSAGATIDEWKWDFGDGSDTVTEEDPTTAHTFSAARTYVVRLTVTDSAGRTGTTTANVAVTDP